MNQDDISRFERDITSHTLEIHHEDGLYRHLRFRRPDTRCMHFDLITWPGHLCYTGDMGTYVFFRLEDMLEFFRKTPRDGKTIYDDIDRRYWAEKCLAADRSDGIKEFSREVFVRKLRRLCRVNYVRWSRDHELDEDARADLREALSELDSYYHPYENEHVAGNTVYEWAHRNIKGQTFGFEAEEIPNAQVYTFRFNWCCMALAWGIQKYDEAKAQAKKATA